jgi:uncharacterized protein YigE (DUF2233 family)
MLFYSALHVLEAAFASEGRHNPTHQVLELYVKERHSMVWPAYHRLQSESMKARYLQGGAFAMNAAAVHGDLYRKKWREVRRYVRTLLGPST